MKELLVVRNIFVHHTCFPVDTPISYIHAFHVEKKNWQDIGYHYVVLRACGSWHIVEGRSTEYMGSHCRGRNHDTIGVAINGCYEPYHGMPADILEAEAIETLGELLAMLVTRHSLRTNRITPHYQHSDTACPGRAVRERWSDIIDAVAERLPLEGAP